MTKIGITFYRFVFIGDRPRMHSVRSTCKEQYDNACSLMLIDTMI